MPSIGSKSSLLRSCCTRCKQVLDGASNNNSPSCFLLLGEGETVLAVVVNDEDPMVEDVDVDGGGGVEGVGVGVMFDIAVCPCFRL
jgi:hypothetical protein